MYWRETFSLTLREEYRLRVYGNRVLRIETDGGTFTVINLLVP
jgi:hypothetical protein